MFMMMMAVRSAHRASVPLMSKNRTTILFSVPLGFHALKLECGKNSTIGRTANRNVIQILRGIIRHRGAALVITGFEPGVAR